jgi:hypothetical protein
MKCAADEKLEIIRLVENSHLGVKRTLEISLEWLVPPSTASMRGTSRVLRRA